MSARAVYLVHADRIAMAPFEAEASLYRGDFSAISLLDESLSPAAPRGVLVGTTIDERVLRLGHYCRDAGAVGIVYTCSMYGAAISRAAKALDVPVVDPVKALCEQIILSSARRVAVLGSFEPSIQKILQAFDAAADGATAQTSLNSALVPGALDALRRADRRAHDEAVAAVAAQHSDADCIVLAQASMASAASLIAARMPFVPLLTLPACAMRALRNRVFSQ